MNLSESSAGNAAHYRVKCMLKSGALPKLETLWCIDFCGKRAEHYDHFTGYENKEAVHPVCVKCHHARERSRGTMRVRFQNALCSKQHDATEWSYRSDGTRKCKACKREAPRKSRAKVRGVER